MNIRGSPSDAMTGDSSSSFSPSSFSHYSSADSSSSSSPTSPSVAPDVLSVVPFLWEEKPGVSKHESPKIQGLRTGPLTSTSTCKADPFDSTFVSSRADSSPVFQPLRPPPRLQKSYRPDSAHLQGGSKLLGDGRGSQTFPKRRQQRRSKPDDDPFWLAMKVCTKEKSVSFNGFPTGMRGFTQILKNKDQQSLDIQPWTGAYCVPKNHCIGKSLHSTSPQSSKFSSDRELGSAARSSGFVAGKKDQAGRVEALDKALQGSKDRLYFHSFDDEKRPLSNVNGAASDRDNATVEGKRLSRSASSQHRSQLMDLYSGQRAKAKIPSRKSLLPDLFGCKSSHHNSVIDPSLHPSGRFSSLRSKRPPMS